MAMVRHSSPANATSALCMCASTCADEILDLWAGQFQFLQEANARLMVIVPVTLLMVYLLLLAAFGSHGQALLIMCTVPLSAIGGISALILTQTHFSVSAAVGFIAVSGVAVQNGVILMSSVNHLRKDEGLSPAEAAYKGALSRMRPVLMTATVAMWGLFPVAISTGIGSQSQKPFAIAIIGGLFSATALTLIVLPALYTIFNKSNRGPQNATAVESTAVEV
jgi:cobalt-zinc-cadmium resistance protein CzcA